MVVGVDWDELEVPHISSKSGNIQEQDYKLGPKGHRNQLNKHLIGAAGSA